jgi:type I restriction-modification system DNA methylase subunit
LGFSAEQVDEIIQKLFNRLIFIRTAEDRGIEEKGLLALLHQWKTAGAKGKLFDALRQLFKEYDGFYDSELFDQKLQHLLDNPEIFIENDVIESIILGLYEIPGSMANYNFNDIDADVLGAVYEQYLGHVAEVMKQRAKEAQIKMDLGAFSKTYTLTDKKERRKEHGIYYTPKFITDYIVRETVGRFLQENAGYRDKFHNIKILDPACGSGSFLIRAYDELLKYYANELKKPVDKLDQWERLPILTNSIFGVDLDKQAMEITRLNLLLRSLAHREPLPFLGNNIKQGNSLVSGTDSELEQYLGANWQNQHPFEWQNEFSDVMAKGGFDVVIGNPPYIRQEQLSEFKPLWQKNFECYDGVADIYVYFFERGIKLLKEGGYLAYISSNKYFRSGYGKKLRDFLRTNSSINQIVDFCELPIFTAANDTCVTLLRKKAPSQSDKVTVVVIKTEADLYQIPQTIAQHGTRINQTNLKSEGWTFEGTEGRNLITKITKKGTNLGIYVNNRFYDGIKTGFNKAFVIDEMTRKQLIEEDDRCAEIVKPWLDGHDILRWYPAFDNKFLIEMISSSNHRWPWSAVKTEADGEKIFQETYPALAEYFSQFKAELKQRVDQGQFWWELRACSYWNEFDVPKIVFNETSKELHAFIDQESLRINKTGFIIISEENEYLLGIINSRLMDYYYRTCFPTWGDPWKGGRVQFRKDRMILLPIIQADDSMKGEIVNRVKRIIAVKKLDHNANINALEQEINHLAYDLYGLTPDEVSMVEQSISA